MTTPLVDLLAIVVTLDANQTAQLRAMCDQRLRDLDAVPRSPFHQPTTSLPRCTKCGIMRADHLEGLIAGHQFADEGAELQAGLEEAVKRQDEPDCGACEEGKHVGHTP
jgi:hypothetical protein